MTHIENERLARQLETYANDIRKSKSKVEYMIAFASNATESLESYHIDDSVRILQVVGHLELIKLRFGRELLKVEPNDKP